MISWIEEFVPEWNRLVCLHREKGRSAIEVRHARHSHLIKAFWSRFVQTEREHEGNGNGDELLRRLKRLSKTRTIARIRNEAATRALARMDAGFSIEHLERPRYSREESERARFLNLHAPVNSPAVAGFNHIDRSLEEWHACACLIEEKGETEGFNAVEERRQRWARQWDERMRGIAKRQSEAIEKVEEKDWGRPNTNWVAVAKEMEAAIKYVDEPFGFRLRVIRRFLAYANETGRLYPPDWNFYVAISPFPGSWFHEDGAKRSTLDDLTPYQRRLWAVWTVAQLETAETANEIRRLAAAYLTHRGFSDTAGAIRKEVWGDLRKDVPDGVQLKGRNLLLKIRELAASEPALLKVEEVDELENFLQSFDVG